MATRTGKNTKPQNSKLGMNRTGIEMSPDLAREAMEGAAMTPSSRGDASTLKAVRKEYAKEAGRLGSVPMPTSFKGALMSAKDKVMGNKPEVFIDKLGERLAFERSGVRLYDLFLTKCESMPVGGLPIDDVRHIKEEEYQHFKLVEEVIKSIGGDPTAVTPAANVAGVNAMGLVKTLSDPRTSIAQGLDALLTAELVDNAAWETLIELAAGLGMNDTAKQFTQALREENEHLEKVKSWHQKAVLAESGAAAA